MYEVTLKQTGAYNLNNEIVLMLKDLNEVADVIGLVANDTSIGVDISYVREADMEVAG